MRHAATTASDKTPRSSMSDQPTSEVDEETQEEAPHCPTPRTGTGHGMPSSSDDTMGAMVMPLMAMPVMGMGAMGGMADNSVLPAGPMGQMRARNSAQNTMGAMGTTPQMAMGRASTHVAQSAMPNMNVSRAMSPSGSMKATPSPEKEMRPGDGVMDERSPERMGQGPKLEPDLEPDLAPEMEPGLERRQRESGGMGPSDGPRTNPERNDEPEMETPGDRVASYSSRGTEPSALVGPDAARGEQATAPETMESAAAVPTEVTAAPTGLVARVLRILEHVEELFIG